MKKYKLVLTLLLWSSNGICSVVSTLQTISPEIKKTYPVVSAESTIPNMPRVRSQDSLGVCFGFSSATVAQHYICTQKKISCKSLKETEEVSPMGMVAWANPNDPNKRSGHWLNHTNILFAGMGYGALGHLTLDRTNTLTPESCYPFDQFANRYGSDKEAVDAIISKLRVEYDKYKTEGSACEECLLNTIQKDLGAKTDAEDIAKAIKMKTFEEFLYGAYVGSCIDKEIKLKPPAKMHMFPDFNKTANYSQLMSEIKKVLSTGKPLVLDAICPYYENGKCMGGHSAVITGYRSICKKNNPKDCRDVIKIQNSWGEDWQKRNDDGWLDASVLLGNRTFEEGAISWLEPR